MSRRAEQADEWAFEVFVRRSALDLLRLAVLLTGEHGHAEDLLQQALMRTARRWPVAGQAPMAYARQVLVNLSRDRARAAARRVSEVPLTARIHEDSAHSHEEMLGQRAAVMDALRRLPARQREVVVLRFFADLSVSETASVMGTSEGTVKSYTARALDHLRQALGELGEVQEMIDDR